MIQISEYGPLTDIDEKVRAGERLSFEDGVALYKSNDLPDCGRLRKRVPIGMTPGVNLELNQQ